jgi:hypothetical protein
MTHLLWYFADSHAGMWLARVAVRADLISLSLVSEWCVYLLMRFVMGSKDVSLIVMWRVCVVTGHQFIGRIYIIPAALPSRRIHPP